MYFVTIFTISEVDTIGYQILKKSETFGLKQDFSYPPGGGGVVKRLLVSGRKKSGLLVSEKTKIGIWPAEGRKILEI